MAHFYLLTSQQSSRLQYVLDIAFEQLWGIQVFVIHHLADAQENIPILAYHANPEFYSIPTVPDSGLLWKMDTFVQDWAATPDTLFSNAHPKFAVSFDVLSAIFSVLTQLWLYQPHEVDLHGRPTGKEQPISYLECWVARWSLMLIQSLHLQTQKTRTIEIQLTLDVDRPFFFLYRSLVAQGLSLGKSISRLEWKIALEKWMMVVKGKDPFQTYTTLAEKYDKKNIVWFFLTQSGGLNANTSWDSSWASPVCSILTEAGHQIGLHPSYESFERVDKIFSEKNALEAILGYPIQSARQHFLRSAMHTRRAYLQAGITHDYSLASPFLNGFVGGMPEPFAWYDVEQEKKTALQLHPAAVMDRSLLSYQNMSIEQAYASLMETYTRQLPWGGVFCLLTHNETFSNFGEWKGWNHVFYRFLDSVEF